MIQFELVDAINLLNRTPKVLNAQLRGLQDRWVNLDSEDDILGPRHTVEHMVATEETIWISSLGVILELGRVPQSDEELQPASYSALSMIKLLDQFGMVRRKNLRTLAEWRLTEQQLDFRGSVSDSGEISARELVASWVTHDLSHLAQVSQFLMRQYCLPEFASHRICDYHGTEP